MDAIVTLSFHNVDLIAYNRTVVYLYFSMAWAATGSILLTSDWQYTEPIPTGSFFRLKHTEAPNGGLFAIAQCEVDVEGKLSLIDSQVLAVEKPISDVICLPLPGCFSERRIAIKKLPRQPSLQEELRRLILPGFLQPTDEEIRIVSRSKWVVDVEVSDFVKSSSTTSSGTGTTTSPSTTANSKTLTYASSGDTNGVCYWIGTNYGAEAWTNPHTAGRVACSKSSSDGGYFDNVQNLVDRVANTVGTGNQLNSWIKIDLGSTNKLVVNYYSLKGRSDQYNDNNLMNWKLQGSNDDMTWVDINEQINNSLLPTTWKSLPVTDQTQGYRYLQIFHTGKNSDNSDVLAIGEFEFYGTLTKV